MRKTVAPSNELTEPATTPQNHHINRPFGVFFFFLSFPIFSPFNSPSIVA